MATQRPSGRVRRGLTWMRERPVWLRVPLGLLLVAGGVLGFLPVLGFWMLSLGLMVLAIDFPPARRMVAWLRLNLRRLRRRFREK